MCFSSLGLLLITTVHYSLELLFVFIQGCSISEALKRVAEVHFIGHCESSERTCAVLVRAGRNTVHHRLRSNLVLIRSRPHPLSRQLRSDFALIIIFSPAQRFRRERR